MEPIKAEPIEEIMECIKSETVEDNMECIPSVSTKDECVIANAFFIQGMKEEVEEFDAHDSAPPLKKLKVEPNTVTDSSSTQESNTLAPIEFVGVKDESSSEVSSSEESSSDDDDQQWEQFLVDGSLSKSQGSSSSEHKRPGSPATLKFSCLKCSFMTDTRNKLYAHNKIQKHYKCPYDCLYVAATSQYLKRHNLKIHKKSNSHKGTQCDSAFITKAVLKRHSEVAHFGTKCNLCEQTFPLLESLKTHIRKFHEKKFQCPNCEYWTDEQASWDAHCKSVHKKSYKCIDCSKNYSSRSGLWMHDQRWHSVRQPLPCPECSFSTTSKLEYEEHWKSMHFSGTAFECHACEFKSRYKEVWQNHIYTVHTPHTISLLTNKLSQDNLEKSDPTNPFQCAHCKFLGVSTTELKRHIAAFHSDVHHDLRCSRCDFSAYQDFSLIEHVAEMHPGQKPFQCLDCGYGFKSSAILRQHIKVIHLKLKRVQCASCQYGTYEKSFMEKHIQKTGHKQILHK